MGQRALGRREGKLIEKTLEWSKYKERMEAVEELERGKRLHFPGWTKNFIAGAFGIVALGGLSIGAIKTIPLFMVKPASAPAAPAYMYGQFEADAKEERILEHAKLLGTDDKKLSMEKLHEKYIYTFDEQGKVVHRMPEDYRTVAFLFGDSIARSIISWSNFFGTDPAIVVAILCAENGSSEDPRILNTVSAKFMRNPHLADQTVSRSGARGIAQIKPSTAEITIKKLVEEGRWPFQTTDVSGVLSDYNMSIFLLCALIREIQTSGYSDIKNIAGAYHSGNNGWSRKKAMGENDDEVWKHIKKAQLSVQQYEGVRGYLKEPYSK